eukprot:1260177-Rhodomonas_salina.1
MLGSPKFLVYQHPPWLIRAESSEGKSFKMPRISVSCPVCFLTCSEMSGSNTVDDVTRWWVQRWRIETGHPQSQLSETQTPAKEAKTHAREAVKAKAASDQL